MNATLTRLCFDAVDAGRAYEEWGCNCGPGALAAVLGLELDEVRSHLIGFDTKRYTNPTMMCAALDSLGASWRVTTSPKPVAWPQYGLARVQFEGPWTAPGVPPRVAYRHTHWIGVHAFDRAAIRIFDINCMASGGWVRLVDWADIIVPWLLAEAVPRADGKWHLTHAVEIARR